MVKSKTSVVFVSLGIEKFGFTFSIFFLSLLYLLSQDRLEIVLFCANYKNHTDLRAVAYR